MLPFPYMSPNGRRGSIRKRLPHVPNENEMSYQYPLAHHSNHSLEIQRFSQEFQYKTPSQTSVPYQNRYPPHQNFNSNYQYSHHSVSYADTPNSFCPVTTPFYEARPYQNSNFPVPYFQNDVYSQQQYSSDYLYNSCPRPMSRIFVPPTTSKTLNDKNKKCHRTDKHLNGYQSGMPIFSSSRSYVENRSESASHMPMFHSSISNPFENQPDTASHMPMFHSFKSINAENQSYSAKTFDCKLTSPEYSSEEETFPSIISTLALQTDSDESQLRAVMNQIIESVSMDKLSKVNINENIPDISTQVASVNRLIKKEIKVKSTNKIFNQTVLQYENFTHKMDEFDSSFNALNISSNVNGIQFKNGKQTKYTSILNDDHSVINGIDFTVGVASTDLRNTFDRIQLQNTETESHHNETNQSARQRLSVFVNLTERESYSDKHNTNYKS